MTFDFKNVDLRLSTSSIIIINQSKIIMLKNWFKIFFHQVRNNKFFTMLNVLGLSLGIAGLVFAILYWNDEHEYNAWNPEKEYVFQVSNNLGENMTYPSNISPLQKHLNTIPNVESYAYMSNGYKNDIVEYNGKKEELKIVHTQSNFFSFFPFHFIEGNGKSALQDDASVALSTNAAHKFFGDEKALGKQIKFKNKTLV